MNSNIKVLYFGFYNPEYSRNRVLIKGLRQNGVTVVECNERSNSSLRYLKLFYRYLRMRPKYDIMIVGFPGQEVMLLAKLISLQLFLGQARKPIIFDAFTSHYGGYILDRQYFSRDSLRAKYYRFLDSWSCRLANLVLLDTQAHINFFVKEFGLLPDKFRRIFVGTDSGVFYPRQIFASQNLSGQAIESKSKFLVHFHGHYIPLQGVEYIIRTAKILEKENIIFNLIGRGQTYKKDRKLADDLGVKNINFMDKVPYRDLAEYLSKANISLGIFGDSPKTEVVIPNKIFEALASKKAVITSDTQAVRELLEDNHTALFVKRADPEDLAEKIIKLRDDINIRNKIAENGYQLFKTKLVEKKLGEDLINYITQIL